MTNSERMSYPNGYKNFWKWLMIALLFGMFLFVLPSCCDCRRESEVIKRQARENARLQKENNMQRASMMENQELYEELRNGVKDLDNDSLRNVILHGTGNPAR